MTSDIDRIASIPNAPTHAVHMVDNWDGEGDRVFVFAFELGGELYSHETGKPLLLYVGDEIIKSWPLN